MEGGYAGLVLRLSVTGAPRLGAYLTYPQRLAYAWCDAACTEGASWQAHDVPLEEGEGGDGFDLLLDADERPHLAYSGSFSTDLYYGFCSANCETASPTWRLGSLVEASDEVTPEPPYPVCGPGETLMSYWYPSNAPVLALDAAGNPEFAYRTDNLQGCDGVYVGDGPPLIRYRGGLSAQDTTPPVEARL